MTTAFALFALTFGVMAAASVGLAVGLLLGRGAPPAGCGAGLDGSSCALCGRSACPRTEERRA